MNQVKALLQATSTKGKAAMAAGLLGTLVVFVLLAKLATAPSYQTLLTGIDPAQTGKVTRALDEQGVAYQLENGGTALGVKPDQVAQARIALAEEGLPGDGQPGFELFDDQKLGVSDFQQKVNYQRALEGEIAGTVEQVQGVSGAQVRLVLPDDQLFAEDRKPATAAVLLSGGSDALEPGAVRGMAQLVASSVEGLKTDAVTITDGTGQMLWPRGDGAGDSGLLSKQAAEQRHDQLLEGQLTALLASTVGAGKAQVQVQSELNVDKATEDKLVYGRRGVALKRQTEQEELEGGAAGGAGGRAGTAGNLPNYAAGAAAGGSSNYNRETENSDFGVDKTVTKREIAPGAVEKLNVAVVLDATVPAATATQLQAAVTSAAGIDAERGDTLTVSRVAFARPETPAAPGMAAGAAGYAKWVLLGLGTLLFLFFVTRALRKREREALAEPTWLHELTSPQSLAALETGAAPTQQVDSVRQRAERVAEREPDKVAQQLRSWLDEDRR